jgi:hypothetical protein
MVASDPFVLPLSDRAWRHEEALETLVTDAIASLPRE